MSRKFLVPLVLPADPAAAMEAATKQYVDTMNEVAIAASDPGAAFELWYDTGDPGVSLPNMPRGIVLPIPLLGTTVSVAASALGNLGNPISFTPIFGRRYRAVISLRAATMTAGTIGQGNLKLSGWAGTADNAFVPMFNFFCGVRYECIWVATSGSPITLTPQATAPSSGGANFYTDPPSVCYIEDVGV